MRRKEQLYEGLYIISATLSDEAKEKAKERIATYIEKYGGKVLKMINWDRKKLKYPIKSAKEGMYTLFYFSSPTESLKPINRENQLNEDLMRNMHISIDKIPEQDSLSFKSLDEEKTGKNHCPIRGSGLKYIDYKDVELLRNFTTERGKIIPRRVTGVCAKYQRKLTQAVKRARNVALMAYAVQD